MKLSKIKKAIEKVKELPTLPVIASKVTTLLSDPKSSTLDLAKIIEKDQSITAKILNLVNSSYYGLPQRVTNITQAIALLGYRNISHIVMTLSVFDTLKSSKKESFDRREFWIHSIAVAIMSVKIAKECMYSFADDVFTAGLLHDIGKVFIDGFLHEEFSAVIDTAYKKGISFYEAEHRLFDFDHIMVGEWIARAWRLPLHVVASIKHHHQDPEQRKGFTASSDISIDFVRAADIAVRIKAIGKNGDGLNFKPRLDKNLFKRLPILKEDVLELMEGLNDDINKSRTLLNIATEG